MSELVRQPGTRVVFRAHLGAVTEHAGGDIRVVRPGERGVVVPVPAALSRVWAGRDLVCIRPDGLIGYVVPCRPEHVAEERVG
jgi:hypothetical protein